MTWTILGRIALGSWLATSGTDAVLTRIVLSQGGYEANPVLAGRPAWVMPVAKGASAATGVWWSAKERKDHPKLVFFVSLGATVAYSYASVHNWLVIQQQRRARP